MSMLALIIKVRWLDRKIEGWLQLVEQLFPSSTPKPTMNEGVKVAAKKVANISAVRSQHVIRQQTGHQCPAIAATTLGQKLHLNADPGDRRVVIW